MNWDDETFDLKEAMIEKKNGCVYSLEYRRCAGSGYLPIRYIGVSLYTQRHQINKFLLPNSRYFLHALFMLINISLIL